MWKASIKPIRKAAFLGRLLCLGPLTEGFSWLLLLVTSPVALEWIYQVGTALPEACPARACSFNAVDKGLYFFHICRQKRSHLMVRTYHLSASVIEEIHLFWLQLLWVPTLAGGRAWILPLPPPSWSLCKNRLDLPFIPPLLCSMLTPSLTWWLSDLSRSHTCHWWGCHCHKLKLQRRAMKSNCCWIVTSQLSSPPTDASFQPLSSFCFFIPPSILRCTTCRTLL